MKKLGDSSAAERDSVKVDVGGSIPPPPANDLESRVLEILLSFPPLFKTDDRMAGKYYPLPPLDQDACELDSDSTTSE